MKKQLLFIVSMLFLCGSVPPDKMDDYTFVGSLQAHSSETKTLNLKRGQVYVEVFSFKGNEKITCQFINDEHIIEQKNTDRCLIQPLLPNDLKIKVRTTNDEDRSIGYKIWIH